jgi:NAD(P)-dependent dehydrogenase (short-subunit alcohol dehydrogenase family)
MEQMQRFAGKTILVTGASSGIGRATAVRMANEGARVVLVARDVPRLEETLSQLAGSTHVVRVCDLTDEAQMTALMTELRTVSGEIHGVAHCAGIHWLRPVQITESKHLMEMLMSHVGSGLSLTRALIGQRLLPKEGGAIVWVSSAAALRGGAGEAAYAAAKGALISAAKSLAVELARRRVRVNVVVPGVVRTPQSEAFLATLAPEQAKAVEQRHLLGLGEPADVAASIAFLLSSDARWITGSYIVVDGGLMAH